MTTPAPTRDDPIDLMLERIRRALLDLTRRNRLLNFKSVRGRVSLQIVDEVPEEVFRLLVGEGRTLQFLAREEAKQGAALGAPVMATNAASTEFDAADEGSPLDDIVPEVAGDGEDPLDGDGVEWDGCADAGAAGDDPEQCVDQGEVHFELATLDGQVERAERHTDLMLQTDLPGEQLQKALIHLAREARSALEERGTNTLFITLGMVEWTEPAKPDQPSRAPLLFLPVELKRKNVNRRYRVSMLDGEVMTNPSLLELCRRSIGAELPEADLEQEFDPGTYFRRVTAAIAALPGWRLLPEVHLGLFSFAKLLLYQDLDPAHWPVDGNLARHPLVRLLAGVPGSEAPAGAELPDTRRLDETIEPEQSFQVVSADSSQQAAIVAAKHGANLVIQGPPGTGKSQTITNIIAECLAAGRSVLFVAEKAAALDVVKSRLERAGLGDVVLDLHSRTASRRAVLEELRRSLEAEPDVVPAAAEGRELARTRAELNAYVRDLHQPIGGLAISPYDAMARAVETRDAPEIAVDLPGYFDWSAEEYAALEEHVAQLERCLQRTGPIAVHPFRGAAVARGGLEVRQRVVRQLQAALAAVERLRVVAAALAERIGAPPPADLASITRSLDAAQALANAPPWCGDALGNDRFDRLDAGLRRLLQLGCDRQALMTRWAPSMTADAEQADWRETLERRRTDGGALLRLLKPSWYRDGRRIRGYRKPGVEIGAAEEIEVLKALVASAALRRELEAEEVRLRELFGAHWRGVDSDFRVLLQGVEVIIDLRARLRGGQIGEGAARGVIGAAGRTELAELRERVIRQLAATNGELAQFLDGVDAAAEGWFGGALEQVPLGDIAARLGEAGREIERLQDWVDLQVALLACREGSRGDRLGPFLDWALHGAGTAHVGAFRPIFRRHFHHLFADRALEERPALRRFRGEDRQALIDRFRTADREWIEMSRSRLRRLLLGRRPDYGHDAGPTSKLGILKHEMRKKRRHMPLRKLLELVGDVVLGIKPCFMMSPSSVAQFLAPAGLRFDTVIFDEASQVEPADALGAIARGRQLLLIGDENQLPPTDFFGRIDDASGTLDDVASATELESILGLGAVRFPRANQCSLRWHYRSLHQSLIEFSNARFYDHQLRIFPSPHAHRDEYGLVFEHVADGVYQRGAGSNPVEARRVAEAALRHAVDHPRLSLGVGAFSMSQQRAIEDQVELLRRQSTDPRVEAFFAGETAEPFFVKNLETIQGDERDVIFLSVGYGPDQHGKVSMNLGPLNKDGGWRRLNVLVTRARQRCVLFSSMRADAIRLDATDAEGVRALKEYLATAERGAPVEVPVARGGFQSPFEEAVRDALVRRGFEVHSQVGVAGFHIDLAVVDPRWPGRYLLGIECDGAVYHSSATARDRDRIRQEVLESRGWIIERVWSTDWYRRPQAVLEALCERITAVIEDAGRGDPPPPAAVAVTAPPIAVAAAAEARQPTAAPGDVAPTVTAAAVPVADELPAGISAYRRAPARSLGSADQLTGARRDRLATVIAEVIAVEWPIHREEAQRVVLSWYDARSSVRTREAFDEGVEAGVRDGLFVERDGFLWPIDAGAPPIRQRDGEDAVTDPDHIAAEECRALVLWVAHKEMGAPLEALVKSAARTLGFARCTARLAVRLEGAAADLLASGELVADAAGFLTARSAPSA